MNYPRPIAHLLFAGVLAALCPGVHPAHSAEPVFPPGVRLIDPVPAAAMVPRGIAVHGIEVDWTNPLLSVRLELGLDDGAAVPRRWDRIGEGAVLKIQLAEPQAAGDTWKLALNAAPPPSPSGASRRADVSIEQGNPQPTGTATTDLVRIGGICPWFFDGPTPRGDLDPISPLGEGSGWVDVRWLGRAAQWIDQPPDIPLRDFMILSTLDPATGRGSFFLLEKRSGNARIPLASLSQWIEAAIPSTAWVALHSTGREARVTLGDWRLGQPPRGRARARAGAVLVIAEKKAGDTVDWARLGKPRVTASSSEGRHPAASVASGLLWPNSMAPSIWMSRLPDLRRPKPASVELELPRPRPIHTVRLIYAEAAGFSEHFNPREATITIWEAGRARSSRTLDLTDITGAYTTVRLAGPISLERIAIELTDPGRFDLLSPARLMAVQLLGPWDGDD